MNIHSKAWFTKRTRPDSADCGYVDTLEDRVDAHPVAVDDLLVKRH
jgi:hypothetical protein